MKKEYIIPSMTVVTLQSSRLMTASEEYHGESGTRYRNKLWDDDDSDNLWADED